MASKTKKIFLVVLYNVKLTESGFYQSFNEIAESGQKLIIFDNSPKTMLDIELGEDFVYFNDKENKGLYFAYNWAIKYCQDNNFEQLAIFDQDTKINIGYYQNFIFENITNDKNVFCWVPNVVDQNNHRISPFSIEKSLFPFWYSQNTFAAINSGIILNINMVGNSREVYSSKYPVDFLDYDFFINLYKRKKQIKVLPLRLNQELSVSNYQTLSDRRLFEFNKYGLQFVREYFPKKVYLFKARLLLRALKSLIRYKSVSKFKILLRLL